MATGLCVAVGVGRTDGVRDGVGVGVGVAMLELNGVTDRAGAEAAVLGGAQPVSATPASTVAAATRRPMAVLVTLAPVVRLLPGRH